MSLSVETVKKELAGYPVTVSKVDNIIKVVTTKFMKNGNFQRLRETVESKFGGKWVSAGKDSHFQIPCSKIPVKVTHPEKIPYDPYVAMAQALKDANRAWEEIQALGDDV